MTSNERNRRPACRLTLRRCGEDAQSEGLPNRVLDLLGQPRVEIRRAGGLSGGFGSRCEACPSNGSPRIVCNFSNLGRAAPILIKGPGAY